MWATTLVAMLTRVDEMGARGCVNHLTCFAWSEICVDVAYHQVVTTSAQAHIKQLRVKVMFLNSSTAPGGCPALETLPCLCSRLIALENLGMQQCVYE